MRKGNLLMMVVAGFTALAALGAWIGLRQDSAERYHADVVTALSTTDSSIHYQRATQIQPFEFPKDFGPHPQFQTEWWYYTGNLVSGQGEHYGYQLTFFRRAIAPHPLQGVSEWRTNQIYFAHFAITDVTKKQFHSFERFSRGALQLAGSQADPYRVWIEDWQVKQVGERYQLEAAEKEISLHLELTSHKPILLQGDRGLSKKGQAEGNASYYFSQTRLSTRGEITIGTTTTSVAGYSWLDKEWSTSVLEQGESGWDWFSIQLDDNRELMLFEIRSKTGKRSPFSSGSYLDADGTKQPLNASQFIIEPTSSWTSSVTGKTYPASWNITIPSLELTFSLTPYLNNQEHNHSFIYWEGAVRVTGDKLTGNGYVELTGY